MLICQPEMKAPHNISSDNKLTFTSCRSFLVSVIFVKNCDREHLVLHVCCNYFEVVAVKINQKSNLWNQISNIKANTYIFLNRISRPKLEC